MPTVDAAPVVFDLDVDMVAALVGVQPNKTLAGFPGLGAVGGGLDAVIDGVANDVHQGVAQFLDHLLVEFGVGAVDVELDLLAAFLRELAHDSQELVKNLPERHHARLHDAVAQFAGLALKRAAGLVEIAHGPGRGALFKPELLGIFVDLRRKKDNFADHVHDLVEFFDVDANGLRNAPDRRHVGGL